MKQKCKITKKNKSYKVMAALLTAGALTVAGYTFLPLMMEKANASGDEQSLNADKAAAKDVSPFELHATQAGVTACKDVFTTLGSVMASDSEYRTASFWNQEAGDNHAIGSIAGLNFNSPDFRGKGAGVVYGAPVNGSCEGVSVRIVPVSTNCTDFVNSFEKETMQREDLNGVALMMFNSGAKVMALPVADTNSCVAITTIFGNGELE